METKHRKPAFVISNWGQSSWPTSEQEAKHEASGNRRIVTIDQSLCQIATFEPLSIKTTHKDTRFDIRGPSGSVRGYRDIVRSSLERIKLAISGKMGRQFGSTNLASFASNNNNTKRTAQLMDHYYRSMYLDKLIADEKDLCVLYTTTLSVIRRTFEDSKSMK